MKISIRPVTLRRVIETLDLSIKEGCLDPSVLSAKLRTTQRRAQEILLEIERMKFLEGDKDKKFSPNKIAAGFIDAFNHEKWERMHDMLLKNYVFYRVFVDRLQRDVSQSGFTKSDLLAIFVSEPQLSFNPTTIDVLCDWAERLGVVQRNLYTNRYYITNNVIDFQEFITFLQTTYEELNIKLRPGVKQKYVEIAKLREHVCEGLKIKREAFDFLFTDIFKKSYGRIELSGAPFTSIAKKSPTSLKKVKKGMKDSILSPQFICLKEGRGIEINGKEYHYVAIFDPIR